MPYTTPARYCDEVGLSEARTQLLDQGRVLTAELLQQVLAFVAGTAWPVETTTPQRVVAMAAHDRLQRKLGTVSQYMDGYLRAAVTLPLGPADPALGTLEECCTAIARDELASDPDVSTDLVRERAQRWRKWLVDVSNGVTHLVSAADELPTRGTGKVLHGTAKSSYDWDAFGRV
jgi:phage gp36-like protein